MTVHLHPVLGFNRPNTDDTYVCSMCCREIPDDHVPLMLFSGDRMWVYCAMCDGPMAKRVFQAQPCGSDNR